MFQVLEEQGDGWYRLTMNPAAVFPSTDQAPNWTILNAGVTAAEESGIQLIGVISGWPDGLNPFASNSTVSFTSAVSAYVSAVQQLVEKYEPGGIVAHTHHWASYGVNTWEIWNEPVTPSYWGGTAQQYTELAQATAQAIRAIDPDATILAYDDDASALAAQGPGLYSGLSLHYYPGTLPPDNSTFGATAAVTQAVYNATTVGGSLWLTEAGWSTLDVSDTAQAQDWVDTVLDSLTAGASHVLLFTQMYPGSGFSDEHPDLTPKPAYPALAALNHVLAGSTPTGALTLPAPLLADAFTDGATTTVALWSTSPSVQMTLTNNPLGCQVDDWMDNSLSTGNGPVSLTVSPSPIYLACPSTSAASIQSWLETALPVSISPGNTVGSAAITATPMQSGETLAISISASNSSAPTVNTPLPTGATSYVSGTSLPNLAVGDEITVYALSSTGLVTSWAQIPVTASDLAQAAPPIQSLTVTPGTGVGTTQFVVTPNIPGDTFAIAFGSEPAPALGGVLPEGAVRYVSGSVLSGLTIGTTVNLYEVNQARTVEAWTPMTLTALDVSSGSSPASVAPVLTPETVTVNGVTTTVIGNQSFNSAVAIANGTSPGYVEERAAIAAGISFDREGTDSTYLSCILSGIAVGQQQHVSAIEQGQFAALYQSLEIIPTWNQTTLSVAQGLSLLAKAHASTLCEENYLVQLWGFSWANAEAAAANGFQTPSTLA
jgi:hypothetical protein